MKYYKVTCHRGHCGTGKSTDICFSVKARNLLEACDIARKMPSVKHTRGVINAKEITFVEYQEMRTINAYKTSIKLV